MRAGLAVMVVVSVARLMLVLTADWLEAWPFLISRSRDWRSVSGFLSGLLTGWVASLLTVAVSRRATAGGFHPGTALGQAGGPAHTGGQRHATVMLAHSRRRPRPRVTWLQPKPRPSWRTREALAARAEALVLREVRYRLGTQGFRTRQITLVTMRLDPEVYRVADLAALSRRRWQVEGCQMQPVNMRRCPLRRAPWAISGLRGSLTREHVGDLHVLPGDDDFPDQALHDGLAFFTGEPVQVVTQQAPKGFGMLNDLLPMPRLLLGTGYLLAFLLNLLHLRGKSQPPRLSCAQADSLSLIGLESARALPLQALPPLQESGLLRGEGRVMLLLRLCPALMRVRHQRRRLS